MDAMTLDHLSGGRVVLGLGVSGPRVVEGWYGQPFAKPLARMREYIGILRAIWAREGPVESQGPHFPLPLPGGTGLGKPLEASVRPLRQDIPIYLAAEGPRTSHWTGELCDGRGVRGGGDGAADRDRRHRGDRRCPASDVGPVLRRDGGPRDEPHANVAIRMGYEAEVAKIQELYLSGHKREAAAAVPTRLLDELTLIGSPEKIRHDLEAWRDSIVTTLLIAAELVLG